MHLIILLSILMFALPTFSLSNIASADDLIKSSPVGPNEEFRVGCSLRCAVGCVMKASSTRTPQGKVKYGIDNINDGNLSTAWVPAKNGAGDSVSFIFRKKQFADMESTTFWGIDIINGYMKKSGWQENARIKKIRLEHNDKRLYELSLHDMEVQSVRFDPFTIRPGSVVELVILETYPGTQNQDVVINELVPLGAH